MKRLLIIISLTSLLAGRSVSAGEQTMLARITVYWAMGGESQQAFSTGGKLQSGHCAVDPKKIPFGSKVIFPDAACVAVDTGPAVVSRSAARRCAKTVAQRNALVIDRYFESKKQALAWAAAHPHFMTVRVLDPHHQAADLTQNASTGSAQHDATTRLTADDAHSKAGSRNCDFNGLAPTDVRGPLLPTFFGTALPRS